MAFFKTLMERPDAERDTRDREEADAQQQHRDNQADRNRVDALSANESIANQLLPLGAHPAQAGPLPENSRVRHEAAPHQRSQRTILLWLFDDFRGLTWASNACCHAFSPAVS